MANVEQERLSPAEIRKRRKEEEETRVRERNERGFGLPPGVEPGEELDAKENPKVGPQDLSDDDRKDLSLEKPEMGESYGYKEGMRADQMEGVQSAEWVNEVDPEEQLERNLRNPPNMAIREEYYGAEANRTLSPATMREVEAGKNAVNTRRESMELARDPKAVDRIKAGPAGERADRTPATTLTTQEMPDTPKDASPKDRRAAAKTK